VDATAAARERRRTLGAWSTPEWLVAQMLDTVLAGVPTPRSVIDPACGDGRFLLAAAQHWPDAALVGVDIDVEALGAARRLLGSARVELVHGDGLVLPERAGFDLVIGNPPYLNQLARRTNRGGRSALGGGPYADAAALFLARALALSGPAGGAVALVLPRSMLATRDVADIRARVASCAAVEGLWVDDGGAFDADVHTIVLSCRAGAAQGLVHRWQGRSFAPQPAVSLPPAASWSPLVADLAGVPDPGVAADAPRVGSLAVATADFRDQYYGLVGCVGDDADGPPLVTSGAIDPGACAWGRRPVRFARERYEAPRVRLDGLAPKLRAWAARRLVPKALLATQTLVLEACADARGEWLPAVPVISVVPFDPDDVWPVTASLCSPVASAWAARVAMGAGLSATAVRLRASQVGDVPLPAEPWPEAVSALRDGDLHAFGLAMCAASRVEPEPLMAWWLPLAERARR
jgi:SAM-dependent methyltransferase